MWGSQLDHLGLTQVPKQCLVVSVTALAHMLQAVRAADQNVSLSKTVEVLAEILPSQWTASYTAF